MKQLLVLFLLTLLTCSCVTITNGPYQEMMIKANETSQVVIQNDTLQAQKDEALSIIVQRSTKPLDIQVLSPQKSQNVRVRPYRPAHYWANITSLGLGFIVDEISRKQFVYPQKVFLNTTDGDYTPYFPMEDELIHDKNRLSITPSVLFGHYNPGLEISYQRLIGKSAAVQLSITTPFSRDDEYSRNVSGFRAGFEVKKYFQNQERTRLYSSLNIEYFEKNHLSNFEVWDTNSPNNTDSDFYNDIYAVSMLEVDKAYLSLTPRIGVEHYLTKKLVLDGFFGVGVRYRRSEVIGLDPALSIREDFFSTLFGPTLSNRPRNSLTLNFDLNVRVGWVF